MVIESFLLEDWGSVLKGLGLLRRGDTLLSKVGKIKRYKIKKVF